MKAYTQTLLSLAEIDSEMAALAMPKWPHQAAFHAQQCTEKSIKAAAFDFGPYGSEASFRPIGKKVGHVSTRACVEVILTSIKVAMEGAMNEQDRIKDDAAKRGVASYVAYRGAKFASRRVLSSFAKEAKKKLSEDPESRRKAGYWSRSFTETFTTEIPPGMTIPRLSFSQKSLFWVFRKTGSKVGVDEAATARFKEGAVWNEVEFSFLDDMIKKLKESGHPEIAVTAERTRDFVNRAVGPKQEVFKWVGLVLATAPFTDPHAVIARYPSQSQLARYQSNVEGVARLVQRSKLVLSETRTLIESDWREGNKPLTAEHGQTL